MSKILNSMNINDLSNVRVNEKIKELQELVIILQKELINRQEKSEQISIENTCSKEIKRKVFFKQMCLECLNCTKCTIFKDCKDCKDCKDSM